MSGEPPVQAWRRRVEREPPTRMSANAGPSSSRAFGNSATASERENSVSPSKPRFGGPRRDGRDKGRWGTSSWDDRAPAVHNDRQSRKATSGSQISRRAGTRSDEDSRRFKQLFVLLRENSSYGLEGPKLAAALAACTGEHLDTVVLAYTQHLTAVGDAFDRIKTSSDWPLQPVDSADLGDALVLASQLMVTPVPVLEVLPRDNLSVLSFHSGAHQDFYGGINIVWQCFFQLIATVTIKQHLSSLIFSDVDIAQMVRALLAMLRVTGGWLQVDGLRALSYLIFANMSRLGDFRGALLEYLLPIAKEDINVADKHENTYMRTERARMAINCLGNMCVRSSGVLEDHAPSIAWALLQALQRYSTTAKHDFRLTSTLSCCLRAIQNAVGEGIVDLEADIISIIATLRTVMAWGVGVEVDLGDLGLGPSQDETDNSDSGSYALSSLAAFGSLSVSAAPNAGSTKRAVGEAMGGPSWGSSVGVSGLFSSSSSLFSGGFEPALEETDFDSEAGGAEKRSRAPVKYSQSASKVRNYALHCIHTICKAHPKVFFLHWFSLLPSDVSSATAKRPFNGPHLLTVVLFDSMPKLRRLGALVLASIIEASPLAKWVAPASTSREPKQRTAFTSLATRTKELVLAMHSGLLTAMQREKEPMVSVQLIKSAAMLVANTPYQQLGGGVEESALSLVEFVTNLLEDPHAYEEVPMLPPLRLGEMSGIAHKQEIRQGVFSLLCELFGSQLLLPGQLDSLVGLRNAVPDVPLHAVASSLPTPHLDVVAILIAHARQPGGEQPAPDALTVLGKVARSYKHALVRHWGWGEQLRGSLSNVLVNAIQTPSLSALNALKLVEEWTKSDTSTLHSIDPDEVRATVQVHSDEASDFFKLPGALSLFTGEILQLTDQISKDLKALGPISSSSVHPQQQEIDLFVSIRAKIMSCLAFIPMNCWDELSRDVKSRLNQLTFAAARDSTFPAIQVAACRCLGNFGGYAACSLQSPSPGFDAATIVVMSLDLLEELAEGLGRGGTVTSSQVRIRASWALANMLDIDALPLCLPLQRLVQLCRSVLRMLAPGSGTFQRDLPLANSKVTPNAMRAIGNISRWLPLHDSDDGNHMESIWNNIATALVSELTGNNTAKAKWNACYAMGNMFRNKSLPGLLKRRKSADLLSAVYAALLEAVVDNEVPAEPVVAQGRWVSRSARAGIKAPVSSAAKPANFKIRINGAAALVEAKTLEHYGESFVPVLASISRTLANFEKDEQVLNYREVKYRKTLYETLTKAFCHLIDLVTFEHVGRDPKLLQVLAAHSLAYSKVIRGERLRHVMAPSPTADRGQASDMGLVAARSIENTFDKLAGIYLELAPSNLVTFQANAQVLTYEEGAERRATLSP